MDILTIQTCLDVIPHILVVLFITYVYLVMKYHKQQTN